MGDQKQGKSKNILLLAGAFFVPALVLLIVYARFGMFPFGEKSVLIMDMSDQYVNFFAGLRDIVLGKDSLLYSWKMGFGGNFIGVFAYYISSPFSVITFFFPKSMLPTALMVLNIVKIGLCGLSFSIFLKFLFKKNNWSVVVFSTLYALMAYNIAYSMSLMWLDGVIWLPILMIGIEKLIRSGQKALFITVLSIMFISNYYISYMVGIFCLIYFVYRFCVIRFEKQEKPNFPRRLVDFLISAVAAAGISSWLIVPTFFSLLKGKIGGYNYAPDRILNFDFYKIFSKMFVGNYDTITNDGLPNIYCGIIVVILFIAFFFVKSVSGKEKILTLSVLALFLISFYVNYIDMAWHIFQYPNWFPYRYSFLFSFFAIMIAYKAFLKLKEIHVLAFVGATSVILIALYMFSKQVYQPKPHIQNTLVIILCILYLICLVVTKFNKKLYKFVLPLMIGLVMFETYSSSYDIVKGLDRNFIYKTNESYVSFKEDIDPVVQKAKQAEDGFYRIEKNFERSKNDAIAFGYNGITNYSSAYDRNTNMFLKSLGFAQTYLWSSYFGSTVLTDSLFDVKYVMSKTPLSSHYEKTMDHDGVTLYKNPSAMPLAFMVDKGLLAVDTPSENYLFNQNRLLQGMTGSYDRYFNQISLWETSLFNAYYHENNGVKTYSKINGNSDFYIAFSFSTQKTGPVYASFPTNSRDVSDIFVNGELISRHFTDESDINLYLGDFKANEQIEVKIKPTREILRISDIYFYTLDTDLMNEALTDLKQSEFKIKSFSNTKISGTVDVKDKKLLFTSIGMDDGWTVKVDGKKTDIIAFQNVLMCIDLTEGKHEILMTYSPKGFKPGLILSIFSLVLCLVLFYYKKTGSSAVMQKSCGK